MKLSEDEVLYRVDQTETDLQEYRENIKRWDAMFCLDAGFTKDWQQSVEEDGREQVTLPDPQNVVNLAMRLIDSQPHISIPPRGKTDDEIMVGEKIERWLTGLWTYIDWQQNRKLINDGKWQTFVRGSHIYQALWVKKAYPKKLQKTRFPILIRTLEPSNVGIQRNPLYTDWAYHKYPTSKVVARAQYPDLRKYIDTKKTKGKSDEDEEVQITDFWYTDPKEGDVWNCVMVDDKFAIEPRLMDEYPYIPIIEGYCDSAPTLSQAWRRIGILAAIDGLWQYKCRLTSSLATAVNFATWPHFMVQSESGQSTGDFEVRPGATDHVPMGTQIIATVPPVDIGKLQAILQTVEQSIQQSTFPGVMYGDSGAMQAGFGVSILTEAARGRVTQARESLEMTIQSVNELVLCLIEKNAGKAGVELYAYDAPSNSSYTETLTPKEIGGYYRNIVSLRPAIPQDDMAKQTLLVRMGDGGYISKRTIRDHTSIIDLPPDEESRVMVEQALAIPELQQRAMLLHLTERFPDNWKAFVKGTPLEGAARSMGIWPEEPPPPMPPMMPPGMGGPPGMPPPGPPGMGGPPPGMMPPPGGPPPGMMPPGMPPPGGPPPPIQPPAEMVGPEGNSPGLPPDLQGMITPPMLGMGEQENPLLFQQMMGNPIPPSEELDMIANQGQT